MHTVDEVGFISFQSFLILKLRVTTHFHMKREEGGRIYERIKMFGIQEFDENRWKRWKV